MYTVIIESIAEFDLTIILPVGAGIVLGIVAGAKLIKSMLKNFNQMVYSAILGLVIGSVFIIYPGFLPTMEGVIAIILAAVFAVTSFFLSGKEQP